MKIALVGTISVGKTTLINELSKLPEFKDYTSCTERSKYLNDLGIPLNTDSTINGQMVFMAERASELLNEKLLTDRSIIDVMAFTNSSKSIPYNKKALFEQLAKELIEQYDYIFYVSPEGVDIENNGIRETNSEYRDLIDFTIKHIISTYKHRIKNYSELSGSTEERIKKIKQTIGL